MHDAAENFRVWFGASKVVDAGGSPLVVYHGAKSDFASFSLKHFGASDEGLVGKGFYFTYNPEEASGYALNEQFGKGDAPNVIAVYLCLENPFVITQGVLPDGRKISEIHRGGITSAAGNEIRNMVDAEGHDGVIFASRDGQVRHAIAFFPEQIKSALGNVGAYRKDDPDICDRRSVDLILRQRAIHAAALVESARTSRPRSISP